MRPDSCVEISAFWPFLVACGLALYLMGQLAQVRSLARRLRDARDEDKR